jgi:DNA-binding MarR family transcriptional regulator
MPADTPTLTIARLSRLMENYGTPDLSLSQYRVLGLLSTGDERASQLASRLAVAKPTLTTLIDSLVERGYVSRETPEGDRRAVRLSITPAGRQAASAAGAQLRAVLDDVVGRCDNPEAVFAALEDLRQALDARWAERMTDKAAV